MTDEEMEACVRSMADREVDRLIRGEKDPLVKALMQRDRRALRESFISGTLAANRKARLDRLEAAAKGKPSRRKGLH